jgi:hypothetical protein
MFAKDLKYVNGVTGRAGGEGKKKMQTQIRFGKYGTRV